jgi:hypothetical protein
MTDPIYGDTPLDPEQRWWDTMRPPLVNDPEMLAWKEVITAAMLELNQSSWLVRWRTKSVVTAEGIHLDAKGRDLRFLRPDGWDDDRYRNVLIPLDGIAFGGRPPSATAELAEGLVDGAQTWELATADPMTYIVRFFGITADEALTYFSVLNLARPKAVRMVLEHSTEVAADVFELDSSLLDGTDVLMSSTFSEDY